jgi:predicted transcriptional regulator
MPAVALTPQQKFLRQRRRMSEECDVLLFRKKLSHTQVAEFMGITPQAVNQQFRDHKVTVDTAMAVFYLTDAKPEDIANIMKMKW